MHKAVEAGMDLHYTLEGYIMVFETVLVCGQRYTGFKFQPRKRGNC